MFYQLYFSAINYFAPKWYGNKDAIEAFAQKAVQRTKDKEGMALYARIYWYAAQAQYGDDLFRKSAVVWKNLELGFDQVIAQYPDPWNVNTYAKFACLAGDKQKTRELIEKIGNDLLIPAWGAEYKFKRCKNWMLRPGGDRKPGMRPSIPL